MKLVKLVRNVSMSKIFRNMMVLQSENEDLEQYGRRLCVRVEGAPITDDETSEKVLKKVQSLINEAE